VASCLSLRLHDLACMLTSVAVRAHSRLLRYAHAKVPFEHVGYAIVCAWLIVVVCTVQSIMPQLEEVKTVRLYQ
jgi:hypothetical protein